MLNPREYCFSCMTLLSEPDGVCPKCGKDNHSRKNANTELPFARLAGKYIVGRALGRGGFGITYIGLNERLGKRVAIKEFFPEGVCERSANRTEVCAIPGDTEERFEQGKRKALGEARIIASLSGIPNVVRVYDCFGRSNTIYIIMEYIEGETLANVVSRRGPLKWRQAWKYMRLIAEALDIVHHHGLVHRDVSPDNIMVRKDGEQAVLLDFGAAAPTQADGQVRGDLLKDGYSAPEQYHASDAVDGRSDEYAFCATLYYLLTGVRPVSPAQRRLHENSLKPPRKLHSDIPPAAQEVLKKGMMLDQGDRYATMRELIDALDEASDRGGQRGGISRMLLGIGAAAAIGVCGLMVYAGQQKTPAMVRAASGALAYDRPTGTILTRLEHDTLLSVHDSKRQGQRIWYKVCIPQNGSLQACYISEENVVALDTVRVPAGGSGDR